ncbi:MAG: HPr family phosphocarrier protein [Acholeplasmataceae bacterium]|jgi:phosphocarrier protein|nr:HPr family phosphocarrier protein [Acholeplasmataceae bacterium]MDD2260296.1 HPr family phosphocarrier protein [Acholeplasmataceae bacterium]MDD4204369.1 HPr family phosphocarrier protein [Acholeplasmataceae bacterium]MDD4469321.1 HPr family phosphocarrier protein [Acholeplasmataceae bacterium]MDD4824396.1 HPr family phosphocarrier protein [Acholeplasmataceae bacterium]
MKKNFVVTSEQGIHARPATELVMVANQFESEVMIESNDRSADMKSIMGLMSLGLYRGQKFSIVATGDDGADAVDKLEVLLKEKKLANLDE